MNGSGTQYPPLHDASACVSAPGTYCVGTQWAAPSVQQLGRLEGLIYGGRVFTQPEDPPPDELPVALPLELTVSRILPYRPPTRSVDVTR